jgi:hypothetical protein
MADDSTKAGAPESKSDTERRPAEKASKSRLERLGILAGIATGITGVLISVVSLMQTQAAQRKTDEQEQAAQANLVVTELYPPSAAKGSRVTVMVQNFSNLPIFRLSIIGRDDDDEVGTLPPCSQINITGIAQPPGIDLGWSDGVPPVGLEYTDANGLMWSRVGAEAPQRGQLSAHALAQIHKGSQQFGADFGLEPSTPIQQCD